MLDSLVRVSRRVGWEADKIASDPKRPRLAQPVRESSRQTRLPSLRQSNSPRKPGSHKGRGRSSIPQRLAIRVYNSSARRPNLPSSEACHRRETGRSALPAESAHGGAWRRSTRARRSLSTTPQTCTELSSASRLCRPTRLPLNGFTYS